MDVLGSALIPGGWATEKISIGIDLLPFLISSCCNVSMVDVVKACDLVAPSSND